MSFIGERIRAERKTAGLTGNMLARKVGISTSFVSEIERGTRIPSPDMVLRICAQFPDANSAWWLWLLLRDTWGNEIAEQMRREAVAMYVGEDA